MADQKMDKYIDNSGDKKYFAIIPYYIVNHSTAYEQSLYLVMKRLAGEKGTCYASLTDLAKRMGVARSTTHKTLQGIIERGWIKFLGKKPSKTHPSNEYEIVDLWGENLDYIKSITSQKKSPPDEQSQKKSPPDEQRRVHQVDTKKNDIKNKQLTKEEERTLTPFQKVFISIIKKYPKEFKLYATEDIQWLKDRVENQPQFKSIDLGYEMEGWGTWLEAEHRKKQATQGNTFPKSDFKRSLSNRLKKAVEFKATSRWKSGANSDYPNPNDDPDRVKREAQRAIERTDELLAERERWKKESTVNPTKLIKALKEGKSLDEFKRTLPNSTTCS
uniref:Putative DNA binding, helix-turn-helix domain containing protein n=1 Tax=viral metagenome TaxID=1070528 RepID=A0A6M3JV42_9ZZZZ